MAETVTTKVNESRGTRRRERILAAAAELMAERGYSAVSMADIGAASGIVGSGIYRHFDSKATILVSMLDRAMELMLEGARQAAVEHSPGRGLISALIAKQAETVVRNRSQIAVYLQDSSSLPDEDFRLLRRKQRWLIDEWMFHLEAIAPRTDSGQSRTVVQGVLALINSVCNHDNPMPEERLLDVVRAMCEGAIEKGLGLNTEGGPFLREPADG